MPLIEIQNQQSHVTGDGPENAPILLLVDCVSHADLTSQRPLTGAMGSVYLSQLRAKGIERSKIRIEAICETISPRSSFYALSEDARSYWRAHAFERIQRIASQDSCRVIVPAGEEALRLTTGKAGLMKWHLSPLESIEPFGRKRTIPLLDPSYVMKVFRDIAYVAFGAKRISEELLSPRELRKRKFIIKPTLEETHDWIEKALRSEEVCIDIETGAGQITCVGFSTDPGEALCIQTLPKDRSSPEEFFAIWQAIARVCESPLRKVGQNILYDATCLSAYGIRVRNIYHDTMMAMRFLNPELAKGLDNCARFYSYEPYWKDDAKDWGSRQSIEELYYYNCKDASITLEIAHAQIQQMREEDSHARFHKLAMSLWCAAAEMSWTGFPVRMEELLRLREVNAQEIAKWQTTLDAEAQHFLGKPINGGSHMQVKELLKAMGFRLPMKDGKETSNYGALCELRLKAPDSKALEALQRISKERKLRSSYLNYRFDEAKLRMFFTMYVNSTETGRWSSGTDPWGRGMNVQTVPRDGAMRRQFGYESPS